jgi:hypothetical protein
MALVVVGGNWTGRGDGARAGHVGGSTGGQAPPSAASSSHCGLETKDQGPNDEEEAQSTRESALHPIRKLQCDQVEPGQLDREQEAAEAATFPQLLGSGRKDIQVQRNFPRDALHGQEGGGGGEKSPSNPKAYSKAAESAGHSTSKGETRKRQMKPFNCARNFIFSYYRIKLRTNSISGW